MCVTSTCNCDRVVCVFGKHCEGVCTYVLKMGAYQFYAPQYRTRSVVYVYEC